ncbi:MAG: L-2-hydroxyglutarate oxidase [Candidatus Promineifilaceae bacterium]|nr:L-2-hydroxyglutarate oxidase [Candidatus Promineifilaceae bacterium]
MTDTDIVIVGGGIVGLATAYRISHIAPHMRITILEKEKLLAAHQSGHNSGVLHTGIYYKPGSLKAQNCLLGKKLMEDFCQKEDIPYKICGKVIVATRENERQILHKIFTRGQANGVNCSLISKSQLNEIEPHTAGIEAIHVPEAGIVDYTRVCARLTKTLQDGGHQIFTGAKVFAIEERAHEVIAISYRNDFSTQYLINCAGLFADRVTNMSQMQSPAQIVPFRGEYYELTPEAEHFCRTLIYPVPDPNFPFLGVHFTSKMNGRVECGPNAVLAFAREGYRLSNVNLKDLSEIIGYSGFQKMAKKHWRMGLGEMWRSISKKAFVKALQKLVPEIQIDQLTKSAAGVRAQALSADGSMVDDFAFKESQRIINVINAPSPAATSSLAIGQTIGARLLQRFS